jgi:hypothetical protein
LDARSAQGFGGNGKVLVIFLIFWNAGYRLTASLAVPPTRSKSDMRRMKDRSII